MTREILFPLHFPAPDSEHPDTQTHPRSHTLRCDMQQNVCAPDVACTYGLHALYSSCSSNRNVCSIAVIIITLYHINWSPVQVHDMHDRPPMTQLSRLLGLCA